ncbi:growth arrest and DNA damage-inducible protein GADD45 gamma-like [Haliotis cracherodii]|uniref:growth arrest and DNA damage-inducible protein GADD45 gamma-like n=1 Tax=Haliotis cracherodii TaxID=6455 RepID=UPI001EAFDC42
MAPLISEDLPCAPESIDLYRSELELRKPTSLSKDTDKCEKTPVRGIGFDLANIVREAVRTGQATHGVFQCADLLTTNPDNVMLCILPDASDHCDVTVHIQHTLIQAFCWENDIQMIKVDSVDKLAVLLNVKSTNDAVCGPVSCALIQFPSGDLSPEMERVSQYIDHVTFSDVYPRPVIRLPE